MPADLVHARSAPTPSTNWSSSAWKSPSKFPKATFFAGQLVFQKDTWLHRLLHNQTAYSLQRRLQWAGVPMVILPTRVR